MPDPQMVFERNWDEFRAAGLLWWVNRMLHLFGWALVTEVDDTGSVTRVYPARCRFRGFDREAETENFKSLSTHLDREGPRLVAQAFEDYGNDGLESSGG